MTRASAVPDAPHIVPGDYLNETARFDVANFDKPSIEEQDIGWVPGDPFRRAFPLDYTRTRTRVPICINVHSELWGRRQIAPQSRPLADTVPS